MDVQEIKIEINKTETLVRMLKNSYNASLREGEEIKPKDINSMFDLILEHLTELQL